MIDSWYLSNLCCPRDYLPLKENRNTLQCSSGHSYPVAEGVPVMLLDDADQTIGLAEASLRRARDGQADSRAPHLYLESIGILDLEKQQLAELDRSGVSEIDPVVSCLCAATCGIAYQSAKAKLKSYPIPNLRLPLGNGKLLLDIGCSWGRWSIAAAKKGYQVVGMDPSLGAIMAASRVSRKMGLSIRYLVADARCLPFPEGRFDAVFSYSVFQHFSFNDAEQAVSEVSRVLTPGGTSFIQMANQWGVRSLYHQWRRGFRDAEGFDVRYWDPRNLNKVFSEAIGPTCMSVDCFFGLGLQWTNMKYMDHLSKCATVCSQLLQGLSRIIPLLTYAADSLYLFSIKPVSRGPK